jgi:hypothetical protein
MKVMKVFISSNVTVCVSVLKVIGNDIMLSYQTGKGIDWIMKMATRLKKKNGGYVGSADFSGWQVMANQEYSVASLYMKNLMSPTPLN